VSYIAMVNTCLCIGTNPMYSIDAFSPDFYQWCIT